MYTTITVIDETSPGRETARFALELLQEDLTVAELIRSRVYQEVTEHNAGRQRGGVLVQPTPTEVLLNGRDAAAPRPVDWKAQCERAFAAFRSGNLIILVDDRQAESLDERVRVSSGSEVTFLKLLPLVGG